MIVNGYEIRPKADLRGADLRKANLRGADLRNANLQGADLQDANLQDAYLWYANLQDANLYGADAAERVCPDSVRRAKILCSILLSPDRNLQHQAPHKAKGPAHQNLHRRMAVPGVNSQRLKQQELAQVQLHPDQIHMMHVIFHVHIDKTN